jgi:hypothetical protein
MALLQKTAIQMVGYDCAAIFVQELMQSDAMMEFRRQ